jgi:serine/threonine protein kinase
LREAQALARVTHAGVVAVHDVGTHGDHVFIAMEFVAGGTLKAWLHERARTWRAIRAVAIEAGRGLAAAHAVGLVHRDVKPDNILVDTRGVARIGDFGLAAGIGEPPKRPSDPVLAGTPSTFPAGPPRATIVGTPAYGAGQFVGEPVFASDSSA